MALLSVLTAPDPKLKIEAKPVMAVDDEVRRLMDDMLETMYAHEGIGLAATQVGVDKRVIVMDLPVGEEESESVVLKLANPEILWTSAETSLMDEACLSVPNQHAPVQRPIKLKVRYLNEHNELIEQDIDGYMARCIQHEIDHLNGILYIDHLSKLKRELILRKLTKARKLQR